jgi:hypothetical protein
MFWLPSKRSVSLSYMVPDAAQACLNVGGGDAELAAALTTTPREGSRQGDLISQPSTLCTRRFPTLIYASRVQASPQLIANGTGRTLCGLG